MDSQTKVKLELANPFLRRKKLRVQDGELKAVEIKNPTASAHAARAKATHGESLKPKAKK